MTFRASHAFLPLLVAACAAAIGLASPPGEAARATGAVAPSASASVRAPARSPATAPVPASWAAPEAVPAVTFAEASRLFRAGRHAAAYGRFVTLANEGDMHAARVALLMHRFGPTLFGSEWDATTEELAEWSRLARQAEQVDIETRLSIGKAK